MTETVQTSTSKKITAVAKELNVGLTTILAFLKERGIAKSLSSSLDEEHVQLLNAHFRKDHDEKEKREKKKHDLEEQRKDAIKKYEEKKATSSVISKPTHTQVSPPSAPLLKKRTKKETVEIPVVVEKKPTEVSAPEVIEIQVQQVEAKTLIEEIPETQPQDAITIGVIEHKTEIESVAEAIHTPEPSIEVSGEKDIKGKPETVTPTAEEVRHKKKKEKIKEQLVTGLERVRSQKKGITLLGKIELGKKKPPTPEQQPKGGAPVAVTPARDADKKKKKKKRVKENKVAQQEDLASKAVKTKKQKKLVIDQQEVDRVIVQTLTSADAETAWKSAVKQAKKRKEKRREEAVQRDIESAQREKTLLRVTEYVSVAELANLMRVNVAEVIQRCFSYGKMVTINQRLEKDMIELLADEFGLILEFQKEYTADGLEDIVDANETLKSRAPIVTIMGHVDHGKTSLLDFIRSANVVAGEAGGITQHIGAYEVTLPDERQITFLDTPGHEAFTAMRARGVQLTDIVVLVVAADDSVMPQTLEAISHAQAGNVSIIIAINKIDKPGANPDKIRQQLSKRNILVEEYGGKYQCAEISAKFGKNVDVLLEKILLEADTMNLRANPDRLARGAVIEAKLDKGKGTVATVLIQKGTLFIGSPFICGNVSGRIRSMYDERNRRVESVGPSQPVQITGFDGIPQAGDEFIVVESERVARDISLLRSQLKREQDFRQRRVVTLDDISAQIKEGQIQDLNVLVKGDVDGSVEALSDSLQKLSNAEVRVNVVHRGVGAITESDVLLAAASGAVIVGFNVRPNLTSRNLASKEKVDIRLYNIIYNAIEEVKKALEGMLAPDVKEEITCTIDIRDTFKVPKVGTIAGCYVADGNITRSTKVRLIRDGIELFKGGISSLKRFKEDVREVASGFECGIGLDGYNDLKVGDVIEGFKMVEIKRTL